MSLKKGATTSDEQVPALPVSPEAEAASIRRPDTWNGVAADAALARDGLSAFRDNTNLNFAVVGGGAFSITSVSRSAPSVRDYAAFVLDMDGVLQRCGVAVPGAAAFLRTLDELGHPYVLLTNEDRYTCAELASKLKHLLGVGPPVAQIYTAASSAADFIERLFRHAFDESTYVLGEHGLVDALRSVYAARATNGVLLANDEDDALLENSPRIRYVVIGCQFAERTRLAERACEYVRRGARLIYTCPDEFDVYSDGRFCFGMAKPLVDLICSSCGVTAYCTGKPNAHMLRNALKRLLRKQPMLGWKDVLFVGDSINTDIRTSIENGVDCALVMSGTTDAAKLEASAIQPNFVFPSVQELGDTLREAKEAEKSSS